MLWCIRRTNVYLDDAQTVALDEVARGQGILRAELVRGLRSTSVDQEADLAAIEESFGVLVHDGSGRGPDEGAAHLAQLRRS